MKWCAGLAVLLLAAVINNGRLIACGDKYLNIGFGTHFERTPEDRRQATVLFYSEPGFPLDRTIQDLAVQPTMNKDGYQPLFVSSWAAVSDAIFAACSPISFSGRKGVPASSVSQSPVLGSLAVCSR